MEKIIAGEVVNIIYSNEEGFKICSLFVDNEIITIKGTLPKIEVGQNIECVGKDVIHPKFGLQFEVKTFKEIFPTKSDDILRYLSSGAINGIGEKLAIRIVELYGEDSLVIIENDPEELSKVKGISLKKAKEISFEFQSKRMLFRIMDELKEYNLNIDIINKLHLKYKENTIEKIKKDPYIILENTTKISFFDIDKIALKSGVNINYEGRIKSAIKYALSLSLKNGHTFVEKENLVEYIKALTTSKAEFIDAALKSMEINDEIILRDDKVSEYKIGYFEIASANSINYRLDYFNKNIKKSIRTIEKKKKDILEKIQNYEEHLNMTLTNDQKNAILESLQNNLTIITGGPGTGKTTITKFIIDIYMKEKLKHGIILAAPTGKAAKRITDLTGHFATTIHRLLELNPEEENIYDVKKIFADLIIIDESSMIDTTMLYYLLEGLNLDAKIIFIGDVDQLPSVGAGSVLKDMIESNKINTIRLKEVFRQAQNSNIIMNAHRINNGQYIEIKYENMIDDMNIYECSDTNDMINKLTKELDKKMEDISIIDFYENTQILSATKKGEAGIVELNKFVQQKYNTLEKSNKKKLQQKEFGKILFRENDRIIQIKNNYNRIWKYNVVESDNIYNGIFNGEMGTIINIDNEEKNLLIQFDDGKLSLYQFSELEEIMHAYAITVHKSQGSEFNNIVLLIPNSMPKLLTRNLLYTAITRAKKHIDIFVVKNVLKKMVDTVDIKTRKTYFKEELNGNETSSY